MLISFSVNYCQYPLLMSFSFFFQIYFLGWHYYAYDSFAFPLLNCFFLMLAIIPELIIVYRIKTKDLTVPEVRKINLNVEFTQVNNPGLKVKVSIGLLLLPGCLNFISNLLFIKYANVQSYGYSTIQTLLGISLTWLLCYFCFHRKLYRHHIFSLALIAIGCIFFYSTQRDSFKAYTEFIYSSFGMFFANQIAYAIISSIQNVFEHYLMIIKYISPYRLLFLEGAVSFALCLIYLGFTQIYFSIEYGAPFYFLMQAKWETLSADFSMLFDFSNTKVLCTLAYIIFGFLASLFRIQTNRLQSPTHQYMAEILFGIYFFINDVIKSYGASYIVERVAYSVILIIALLIFNEVVILHFFNLHRNTMKQIAQRANEDQSLIDLRELHQEDLDVFGVESLRTQEVNARLIDLY